MHDIFLFSPVFFVRDFFCRKIPCAGRKVHHEPASSCSPTRISREILNFPLTGAKVRNPILPCSARNSGRGLVTRGSSAPQRAAGRSTGPRGIQYVQAARICRLWASLIILELPSAHICLHCRTQSRARRGAREVRAAAGGVAGAIRNSAFCPRPEESSRD
jgi:hypothetical protein